MEKLIDIIKSNKTTTDDINSWFITKTQEIIKLSTNHLKYVTRVMPEFDLHDSSHSEAVLDVIENLLDGSAKKMSSCELFFIIASAYLHDCGMAISDYEKKVLELTEGTDEKYIANDSLKNDGKKCLEYVEAKNFIGKNKKLIYKDFNDEIQNWLFVPHTENELIDYLSRMLIDYQEFRNGNYTIIKECTDFSKTNLSLRVEYIRRTHHKRISEYLRNWGKTQFSAFPVTGMGQRIANDLAAICEAHGEGSEYLKKLGTNVSYYGSETTNLQFVAMLLRIGDIVHFSNDRAPIILRALHHFESDYSFQQWKIKSNGVSYNVSNDTIAFRAFITDPEDYYKLQEYVDGIDYEIGLFTKLTLAWNKKYHIPLKEKVDRKNISFDDSVFTPVPGLKFTLNQSKILKLLMGVGLYKNKYACLRELYQNALDACRCQIAKDGAVGKISTGKIEMGLGEENGEKYLYCLDNGKGMSKAIIENYLLKIGNSYYQSPEFYQEQAKTGYKFTPTSQFGIGILSCFMIGHKMEITTKEEKGDYVSCIINGSREYFYYKNPNIIDKDLVNNSGTIVKVFLTNEISEQINTSEIENLGFVSYDNNGYIQRLRPDLSSDYSKWENSLYKIVDNFVVIVPEQIELYIRWNNGNKQKILSKPIIYSSETLKIEDFDVLDAKINMFGDVCKYKLKEYIDLIDCHVFEIRHQGVQYKTILKLPKPGIEQYGIDVMKHIPIKYSCGVCVDGISVNRADLGIFNFAETLTRHGIVNFYGDNRPQLSVDRTDIIDGEKKEYDNICKDVVIKVLEDAIKQAHSHIKKYVIHQGSELYNMVWECMFHNFNYSSSIFIKVLSQNIYNNIEWNNLCLFLDKNLTIGEFINQDIVTITNYDYGKFDSVSKIIVLNKLYSSLDIIVSNNEVSINYNDLCNDNVLDYDMEDELNRTKYLARTNNYGNTFDEYDIISNLYPIVPEYFYDLVELYEKKGVLNDHFKKINNYSNGIAAFYEQNPLEVDEELGLYMEERERFGRKEVKVRTLNKKRGSFFFGEIRIPTKEGKADKRYRLAITVYIAPKELTKEELREVANYKDKNPAYYKGVNEGWSIIVTGENEEKMNTFIKAGKCTRKEMVQLIPKSFWDKYCEHIHVFPNGELLMDLI